jgi:lysophospholipase L1-like esterase
MPLRRLLALLLLGPLSLVLGHSAVTAAPVAPTDTALRYVGRFDSAAAEGPRCSWPHSSLAFTLSGGSATVRLRDNGKNLWQVVINGQPASVLALQAGDHDYPIAQQLPPGRHLVELVKRTEASQGTTQVLGLTLAEGATLLPTAPRARRIQAIGDSITCGFGNEAPNKEAKFTAETQNAWLTYGAIAARRFDADYVAIAVSGKKLWPDNTIVALHDRTLANSATPKWDHAAYNPDVIVVNLGTNDFARENPEEAGWVAAYVEFIAQLRALHPGVAIYCSVGPMISNWPGDRTPRTVILGYLEQVVARANADLPAGARPVRLLDFGVQAQHHGIGAQWHPSVRTHEIMAEKLAAALSRDLGW